MSLIPEAGSLYWKIISGEYPKPCKQSSLDKILTFSPKEKSSKIKHSKSLDDLSDLDWLVNDANSFAIYSTDEEEEDYGSSSEDEFFEDSEDFIFNKFDI